MTDIVKIALPYGDYEKTFFDILDCAGFCYDSNFEFKKNNKNQLCVCSVSQLDVVSCVERGAVDVGIVGTDMLMEYMPKILELMKLNIGQLDIGIVAKKDFEDDMGSVLRVATKFPNIAMNYFLKQCRDIDIIKMHDVPEVSLNIDMADVVLDVIKSEDILNKYDLKIIDTISPVDFHLISNVSSFHFKNDVIRNFVNRLKLNVGKYDR